MYISCVDLKHAFWQIELEPKSRDYTALTIPGRPLYQFRMKPFGLCIAAQRLCRLMDRVLPQRLRSKVFVYLDDLLVISKTFEEHKEFRTDPEKVQAIFQIPVPKSVRQLKSFLGTAGWYRRFIRDFSGLSAPLTDCCEPVLVHPDFQQPYFIQCDASHVGIGAVLFQRDAEGSDRPIAFFSVKLRGAQLNYSVPKKKCLAAVKAVERFRPYVEMMPFTIITDHSSLQWLMTLKDLSGRLARWSLALQSFQFSVEHRKGKDNVVADMLSRPFELDELNLFEFETTAFESDEYLDRLKVVQEQQERFPDLRVEEGLQFKRMQFAREDSEEFQWKLWIPEAIASTLIQQAHEGENRMHGGVAKTLARLRQFYDWPRMTVQVREYVLGCDTCKETKHTTQITRRWVRKWSLTVPCRRCIWISWASIRSPVVAMHIYSVHLTILPSTFGSERSPRRRR